MATPASSSTPRPKIAVVGCGHGELNRIYETAETEARVKGWTLSDLDFLIICGDFQAYRNVSDLNCASVPRRFRRLVDFHDYYSGQRKAPVLTIVIGGNHEASNYLFELYHGGWIAPSIYYLGASGVIRYGPWRIAGLSGIYNEDDFRRPHFERLPYERDDIKSIYHVRDYARTKLLRLTGQIDVCLSHDWPMWVELFGDYTTLYNAKPHFFDSAKNARLGSVPALQVLGRLRPRYWFSGHMHTRFAATVEHTHEDIEETIRHLPITEPTRSKLPVFNAQSDPEPSVNASDDKSATPKTDFLALSKPGHDAFLYMAVTELHLPAHDDEGQYSARTEDGKFQLHYDEEWLAIIRTFNDSLRIADPNTLIVQPRKCKKKSTAANVAENRAWVHENITKKDLLRVPYNFERHAPIHDPTDGDTDELPPEYPNSQTAALADLLQIANKFERNTSGADEGLEDMGAQMVEFSLDE